MRMHIGFSFKPKTLLIVLAVILGVVGACVDAYAAEPDNDIPDWALVPALDPDEDTDRGYTTVYDMDGSVLYTDDPALEADDTAAPETPATTIVGDDLLVLGVVAVPLVGISVGLLSRLFRQRV